MTIQIDHVVIAGNNLEAMRSGFAEVGLAPEDGGTHADGLTHNALFGFADGSYLELIAPTPGSDVSTHGWGWGSYMVENNGVCAWAIRTDDIARDVALYRARGISVQEPRQGRRTRPDGLRLEWITTALGDGPMGSLLPFLIQDVTPRENRVPRTASVENVIAGVATVFIGVTADQYDATLTLVQRAFDLPAPHTEGLFTLFADAPIGLVTVDHKDTIFPPSRLSFVPGLAMVVLNRAIPELSQVRPRSLALSPPPGLHDVGWLDPRSLNPVTAQTWIGIR